MNLSPLKPSEAPQLLQGSGLPWAPLRSASTRGGQGSRVGALLKSRAIPSMKPSRLGCLYCLSLPFPDLTHHSSLGFNLLCIITATAHWLWFKNQVNFGSDINKQVEQEGKGMEQKVNFELNSQCGFGFCPGLCIQGLNKHKRKQQRF